MFNRRQEDRDLNEELETFIELLVAEKTRAGMSPAAARRAARIEAGGMTQLTESVREVRSGAALESLVQDIRYAARSLRRSPAFAAVVVLTLALGIGATTAIFSAVEAVVLRPFAGGDLARQVTVLDTWRGQDENVSAGDFVEWRRRARIVDHLAAEAFTNVTMIDANSADRVVAGRVTGDFFAALGGQAALGRTILAGDETSSANVAVLSDGLWRQKFAAAPAVIGRVVQINNDSYQIVGVMPASFDPTLNGERLWIPLALDQAARADHDNHFLQVLGDIRPGATASQAQSELTGIGRQLAKDFPMTNKEIGAHVVTLREANLGPFEKRLYVMLGAVMLVLLIACGNVSNLLLARGSARAREFALRAAIGASRGRIVRQLLSESLLLALCGGALGLVIAEVTIRLFIRNAPPNLPRLDQSAIDGRVLLFAFGLAVASSVVFGLLPSLRLSRQDLQTSLRDNGRSSAGSTRDRVRNALVAVEVALALMLLVGAGLLIRSAINLQRVDAGFKIAGLLTARVALPPVVGANPGPQYEQAFMQLEAALASNPSVSAVALASQAPLGVGGTTNGLLAEGKAADQANFVQSRLHVITPGYFKTLGIPIEAGRPFTDADRHGVDRVMIISETVARRAFPGVDPIGKRLTCCESTPQGIATHTVVGVVGDVHNAGPATKIEPEFYLPLGQAPPEAWGWMNRSMTVLARPATGDPTGLTPLIRSTVAAINKAAPVYAVSTMEQSLATSIADATFNTMLLVTLGLLGLIFAAVGIYSVIGYFVTLRTPEIGIRIALGATGAEVVGLLAREGMEPVVIGAAIGGMSAYVASRVLADALFNVTATDPATFVIVTALLLATGFVATLIPALRASRVDPTRALSQ